VFVSDELAEEGDGGKHPEADGLVGLYRRCCWPALGENFETHWFLMFDSVSAHFPLFPRLALSPRDL